MYLSHNLSSSLSPRPSVVKQLRAQIRQIISNRIDAVALHLIRNLLPNDVCALCICRVERKDTNKESMHHLFSRLDERLAPAGRVAAGAIAAECTRLENSGGAAVGDDSAPAATTEEACAGLIHKPINLILTHDNHVVVQSSSESDLTQVPSPLRYRLVIFRYRHRNVCRFSRDRLRKPSHRHGPVLLKRPERLLVARMGPEAGGQVRYLPPSNG